MPIDSAKHRDGAPAAPRPAEPERAPAAKPDSGESTASTLVERPRQRRHPLDPHDFPDGGGSGGAEAFRRTRTKAP